MTDEYNGYIVVRKAMFEDYISQEEWLSKHIDYKEKNSRYNNQEDFY